MSAMMGQLSSEEIEALLHKGVLGRIGFHNGHKTYVVPISYVYHDGYVYCHSHAGMKTDILRKHPYVCFEVEQIANLANWQTVIMQGYFEELTDPVDRLQALRRLHDRKLPTITSHTTKLTNEWPFESEHLSLIPGVTFRLRITEKTGRFESSDNPTEAFF
jgi:uncharacterized protein